VCDTGQREERDANLKHANELMHHSESPEMFRNEAAVQLRHRARRKQDVRHMMRSLEWLLLDCAPRTAMHRIASRNPQH
jgi:hypothetical protein